MWASWPGWARSLAAPMVAPFAIRRCCPALSAFVCRQPWAWRARGFSLRRAHSAAIVQPDHFDSNFGLSRDTAPLIWLPQLTRRAMRAPVSPPDASPLARANRRTSKRLQLVPIVSSCNFFANAKLAAGCCGLANRCWREIMVVACHHDWPATRFGLIISFGPLI